MLTDRTMRRIVDKAAWPLGHHGNTFTDRIIWLTQAATYRSEARRPLRKSEKDRLLRMAKQCEDAARKGT